MNDNRPIDRLKKKPRKRKAVTWRVWGIKYPDGTLAPFFSIYKERMEILNKGKVVHVEIREL